CSSDLNGYISCSGFVDEGRSEPVRMIALEVTLDTFGAEPSFIEREFHPGFKTYYFVVFCQEFYSALHSAETTMGFDNFIGFIPSGRTFGRGEIQCRAESFYDLFWRDGKCCRFWVF